MDIPTVAVSVVTSLAGGGLAGAFLGYRASKYQTNKQAENESKKIEALREDAAAQRRLEREKFEHEKATASYPFDQRRTMLLEKIRTVLKALNGPIILTSGGEHSDTLRALATDARSYGYHNLANWLKRLSRKVSRQDIEACLTYVANVERYNEDLPPYSDEDEA